MVYSSNSVDQTQQIAQKIAQKFKKQGGLIALYGDLGAGKTTFVQGFARGLGIKEKIISPTFILIRQHQLPSTEHLLYHIDLYRLEKINPQTLGLPEMLSNPQNIILIEWAEKISNQLPPGTIHISLKKTSENTRQITLSVQ